MSLIISWLFYMEHLMHNLYNVDYLFPSPSPLGYLFNIQSLQKLKVAVEDLAFHLGYSPLLYVKKGFPDSQQYLICARYTDTYETGKWTVLGTGETKRACLLLAATTLQWFVDPEETRTALEDYSKMVPSPQAEYHAMACLDFLDTLPA